MEYRSRSAGQVPNTPIPKILIALSGRFRSIDPVFLIISRLKYFQGMLVRNGQERSAFKARRFFLLYRFVVYEKQ